MGRTFLVSFFTLFFLVIFCSQGYPAVRNNKDWSGDQHERLQRSMVRATSTGLAKAKHGRGASGRWKADRNAPVKTAKAKEPVKQAAPRTITGCSAGRRGRRERIYRIPGQKGRHVR